MYGGKPNVGHLLKDIIAEMDSSLYLHPQSCSGGLHCRVTGKVEGLGEELLLCEGRSAPVTVNVLLSFNINSHLQKKEVL